MKALIGCLLRMGAPLSAPLQCTLHTQSSNKLLIPGVNMDRPHSLNPGQVVQRAAWWVANLQKSSGRVYGGVKPISFEACCCGLSQLQRPSGATEGLGESTVRHKKWLSMSFHVFSSRTGWDDLKSVSQLKEHCVKFGILQKAVQYILKFKTTLYIN